MDTSSDLLALRDVRSLARSGGARAIRQAAGLSLSEVADVVGVSTVTVYRWEVGERSPRGAPALSYKNLLDVLSGAGGKSKRGGSKR